MDIEIVKLGLSAISPIAVAWVGFMAARDSRHRKRAEEKADRHLAIRTEENQLSMQMMAASIDLGIATAIAVSEKKVNGEMSRAMESASKAQKNYEAFSQKILAKQVSK